MKRRLSHEARVEKLTQARIAMLQGENILDHSSVRTLREALDYLYFAVEMLMHEMADLKQAKPKVSRGK